MRGGLNDTGSSGSSGSIDLVLVFAGSPQFSTLGYIAGHNDFGASGTDDSFEPGSLAYEVFGPPSHETWAYASQIGDPRTILAWYGASAFIGGAGAISANVSWMDVAVGSGTPFHIAYGVDGVWLGAEGEFFDMTVVESASYARYVQMFGGLRFSVPIIYGGAVLATEGAPAWSCLTGACSAFLAGWGW
jgi:hypothetical protein